MIVSDMRKMGINDGDAGDRVKLKCGTRVAEPNSSARKYEKRKEL